MLFLRTLRCTHFDLGIREFSVEQILDAFHSLTGVYGLKSLTNNYIIMINFENNKKYTPKILLQSVVISNIFIKIFL